MRAKEFIVEFAPTGIYKPPTIPREPGRDPFGDDPRSQMVYKIQQLLDAGKSVFVSIPGARGRAVGTRIGDEYTWLNVRYRDFLKPKSRTRSILTVPLNTDNDADLILSPGPRDRFIQTTGEPFDYILTAQPGLNIDNSDFFLEENFADGKVRGKSRPGRVKRAGASCKGSVTDLRARAKKYGGERGRMYHWCANMKSGRKKNK